MLEEKSCRAVEWEQAELHCPAPAPACGRRYTLARRAAHAVVVLPGAETRAEVGRADKEHCIRVWKTKSTTQLTAAMDGVE